MADTKVEKAKDGGMSADPAPKAPSEDLKAALVKIQNRYAELTKALETEPNINNRYDLRVKIEELVAIFELISRP